MKDIRFEKPPIQRGKFWPAVFALIGRALGAEKHRSRNWPAAGSESVAMNIVKVEDGKGSGKYAMGVQVRVSADLSKVGKAFEKWNTSDGVDLTEARSATASFVMPPHAVRIKAAYREPVAADYFAFDADTGTVIGFYLKGEHHNLREWYHPRIPPYINGIKVTAIGEGAFRNTPIRSIAIPNGVTSIGREAFHCSHLTAALMPNSITEMGELAFSTKALSQVTLSSGLTEIPRAAFGDNELFNVKIPEGVAIINDYAFADNQISSLNIPNSVISIGGCAFLSNNLSSLIIPPGTAAVGPFAFASNRLIRIEIPDGTVVKNGAFQFNPVRRITIGSDVVLGNRLLNDYDDFFREQYYSDGPGTYDYLKGSSGWIKVKT